MLNLVSELLRLILVVIVSMIIATFIVNYIPKEYELTIFNKSEFQKDIISMISNGADFEDIKYLYDSNKYKDESTLTGFKYILKLNHGEFYSKNKDSLDYILRDIKSNILINKEEYKNNSDNLDSRLKLFIKENNEKNPFDVLEKNQKEHFINLRIKLSNSNSYDDVKNDIEKIVIELNEKNSTIKEYLSDATKSYYISLISLILAIIGMLYPSIKVFFRLKS